MRIRIPGIQSLAAASGATLAFLLAAPASAQLSGNAALTSDYVWRGSSQTQKKPAAQAGIKYAHPSGLYASVWGSTVKFRPDNGARSEFDLVAGWSGMVAPDWALDVYLLRYQYPSARAPLNWNELNASVTWREHYWLALGHSGNAMAGGSRGTYAALGARYPLDERLRLEGTVGRYALSKGYADSYAHGSVGAVWTFKPPFEARLTVHGTDAAAKRLFPHMAGTRAELALQASF